jgi:hypothetical protein
MSPFSFSDDELSEIMALSACIAPDHRAAFLQSVADAVAKFPVDCRGVGLIHRLARQRQKEFTGLPSLRSAQGARRRFSAMVRRCGLAETLLAARAP